MSGMEVPPFHIQLNTSDDESENESLIHNAPDVQNGFPTAADIAAYPSPYDTSLLAGGDDRLGVGAPNGYANMPYDLSSASCGYVAGVGDAIVPELFTLVNSEDTTMPDLLSFSGYSASSHDISGGGASVLSESCGGATPMVYPMVYVSPAGLLTVLLRFDVAVEMTTDRTIRVVNHRHKSVAATNSRGNASCIYHTAAKIYQEDTTTEVDVYWERKAKMTTDTILFSSGSSCYTLSPSGLCIAHPSFSDLTKDMSVTLLFSSSGYGPHLMSQYERIAKSSKYHYQGDGGFIVFVNGVKIHQNAKGDVIVTSGPKTIRVSPIYGSMYVETHFVEMAIEMNWNVKVRRGGHRIHASFIGFILTDGFRECGFDQYRQVFARPLTITSQTMGRDKIVRDANMAAAEEEEANVGIEHPFRSGSGTLLSVIIPNGAM